jgi:hypothetical protein
MLIFLWGLPADSPLSAVYDELRLMGADVRLLDQRGVLETRVCLSVGPQVRGQVEARGESFRLEDVAAVYWRSYDASTLPHVIQGGEAARRHAAEIDELLTHWISSTPAFVVSRIEAMAVNNSKPLQLRWIEQFGWRIPHTLITTDPGVAREFWEHHGSVIYKSVSSIRSRVSKLSRDHRERFDAITSCPTQFQEFIPGTDHRVHVVGEVASAADDYRYPGDYDVQYRACTIPREIEDRCRLMSAAMQLPVAGIDLRRTPEGEWVCFEVNPSPGFTAYEEMTGHPIANAIARLLTRPPD